MLNLSKMPRRFTPFKQKSPTVADDNCPFTVSVNFRPFQPADFQCGRVVLSADDIALGLSAVRLLVQA